MISKLFDRSFAAAAADGVDDVEALFELIEQRGDEFGGILKIAVDDDDRTPRGAIEPRRDRGLMAEIAAQSVDRKMRIEVSQFDEQTRRFVGRSVVNNDHFV